LPASRSAQSPHRPKNGQPVEQAANTLLNSVAMERPWATVQCNTQVLVCIRDVLCRSNKGLRNKMRSVFRPMR
jgi:hypothetical protein